MHFASTNHSAGHVLSRCPLLVNTIPRLPLCSLTFSELLHVLCYQGQPLPVNVITLLCAILWSNRVSIILTSQCIWRFLDLSPNGGSMSVLCLIMLRDIPSGCNSRKNWYSLSLSHNSITTTTLFTNYLLNSYSYILYIFSLTID